MSFCIGSTRCSGAGPTTFDTGVQGDLRLLARRSLATGGEPAPPQTPTSQLEVALTPLSAEMVADRGRARALQHRRGRGNSLPLPGESHPLALGGDKTGSRLVAQRAERRRGRRWHRFGANDDGPVTSLDRRAGLGHHRGANMRSPAMLVPSNLRTFAGEKNSLGGTMPPKTPKKRSISDCRPDNGRRIPSSVR